MFDKYLLCQNLATPAENERLPKEIVWLGELADAIEAAIDPFSLDGRLAVNINGGSPELRILPSASVTVAPCGEWCFKVCDVDGTVQISLVSAKRPVVEECVVQYLYGRA